MLIGHMVRRMLRAAWWLASLACLWVFPDVARAAPRGWAGTDARLAELERTAIARAGDVACIGLLHERFDLRDEDVHPRRVAGFLSRVLATRQAHPLVADHAAWLLMRLALDTGDTSQVAAMRQRLGLVTAFALAGPFENTGGASFGVPAGPESGVQPGAVYDGLARPVGFRAVADVGPAGVLAFHDHVAPSDDVLAYALAYVHAPEAVDAALRVGASDQVQAWLNGVPVLLADEQHAWAPDQHAALVRLNKGWNRMLFKVGQLSGAWALVARISAPGGGPLPGLRMDADMAHEAELSPPQLPGAGALVHVLAEVPADAPPAVLKDAWRTRRWLHLDDVRVEPGPEALLLQRLAAALPEDPGVLTDWADEVALRDVNTARSLYERAVTLDARWAPALLGLGRLRTRQELVVEARRLLAAAAQADPSSGRTAVALWEEVASQGADPDEALRQLAAVMRRRPALNVSAAHVRLLQNRGHATEALGAAEKLRGAWGAHRGARALVTDMARRRLDTARMASEWARARLLDPHDAVAALSHAEVLHGSGQGTEAVAMLSAFTAEHPDATEAWQRLGEWLQDSGDLVGAGRAYAQVLSVRPQEAALRRRVAGMGGGDAFEERHKLDVRALSAEAPPPGAVEAGAYVMGHRVAHRLYDNGLTTELVDVAWRVLDRSKGPLAEMMTASYVPARETLDILRAERITRDGAIIPADVQESDPSGRQQGVYTDRRTVKVRFGTLDEGDVVHLRYRVDAAGERNLFGDFYGAMEPAQDVVPKAHYELVVEAPETRRLFHATSQLPAVTEEKGEGITVYRVRADGLPPIVVEPAMPPYTEVGAYAVFSSYASWEAMGRWYWGLVKDQLVPDAALARLARELVEGAADDREKVRRIHRYVITRTRYVGIELGIHGWKPYRVTQVNARGYGDCKDKASLVVALLREVGVDARLVLLRTADLGAVADLASMWSFNHAIAWVPSLDLYLDGTAEQSGIRELPAMDQGAQALAVNVGNGTVQRVSPAVAPSTNNSNTSEYVIRVMPDGSAELQGEEKFTGERAPVERRRFQEEGTRRAVLERDFSQLYPGAAVDAVTVSDPADIDHPLSYRFTATVPGFLQQNAGAPVLPISLYPHELEREYAPSSTRTHDLVLNFPYITRNRMRFRLPAGVVPVALPASTRITTPHFEFVQEITPAPDGYVVEETAHLKSRRIPRAAYAQFRQALVEADRRMRVRVPLRGVSAPPPGGGP